MEKDVTGEDDKNSMQYVLFFNKFLFINIPTIGLFVLNNIISYWRVGVERV